MSRTLHQPFSGVHFHNHFHTLTAQESLEEQLADAMDLRVPLLASAYPHSTPCPTEDAVRCLLGICKRGVATFPMAMLCKTKRHSVMVGLL
eukprot:4066803-Amphidinium_carterae.1